MPYITLMQSPMYRQLSLDDVLAGEIDVRKLIIANDSNTRTIFAKIVDPKFLAQFDIGTMINSLVRFNRVHDNLFRQKRTALYDTFYLPKKSGGVRRIDAPLPELKAALRELKAMMETEMFALYHTSAFGYVKGRCTVDSIKRHQQNRSRWFLKIDFSNFFGNTTLDFIMRALYNIFPFSEICKDKTGYNALRKALSLAFLNDGLPQGTPISPMLTNLMMIGIDHRLYNTLRDFDDHHFIYTRYADDILISCRYDFEYRKVIKLVQDTLKQFDAPFTLKEEKTRYGSNAGSNWNLGVMLNKDNEITIGHKNKARFRAMINNYILDRKNGKQWELHDLQVLMGLYQYYRMVEESYIDEVIKFNNEKHKVDVVAMLKKDMTV